jgi:hypothetical protein
MQLRRNKTYPTLVSIAESRTFDKGLWMTVQYTVQYTVHIHCWGHHSPSSPWIHLAIGERYTQMGLRPFASRNQSLGKDANVELLDENSLA